MTPETFDLILANRLLIFVASLGFLAIWTIPYPVRILDQLLLVVGLFGLLVSFLITPVALRTYSDIGRVIGVIQHPIDIVIYAVAVWVIYILAKRLRGPFQPPWSHQKKTNFVIVAFVEAVFIVFGSFCYPSGCFS